MKDKEDLLGFTFAEIAFVLLYIVFANYFLIEESSQNKIDKLQRELKETKKETELIKNEFNKYKKKAELRSKIIPPCIEKNIERVAGGVGFLFTAIILGTDEYKINDTVLSYRDILTIYSDDLENAKENGCHHSIYIEHTTGLSLETYLKAKKKLERTFYIAEK